MPFQIYLNWLPTLYPLSPAQLSAVIDRYPFLSLAEKTRPVTLGGVSELGGLTVDICLDATGLFLITSELPQTIPVEALTKELTAFGTEADRLYQGLTGLVHVHLFSHRLFPIHDHVSSLPSRTEQIQLILERYDRALLVQQEAFNVKRSNFVDAVHTIAQKLLHWRLLLLPVMTTSVQTGFQNRVIRLPKGLDNYIGRLLELLERRVALAEVSESLYNLRGAYFFYEAFCSLHRERSYETTDGTRIQQTYAVLSEEYRDYTEVVSSYMLQASALFIAFLGVFVTFGGIGMGLLPTNLTFGQKFVGFCLLAAIVYFVVYAFSVRRVAERYLDATKGLLERGMSEREPGKSQRPIG